MHTPLLAFALFALQFPETAPQPGAGAERSVADFALLRSELPSARADALQRGAAAARPRMYVDAIGQRAYVAAQEDGPLEAWIWPLQVFVDGRLTFQPEKSRVAFDGMRRARAVDVEPQSTLIRYASADLDLSSEIIALDGERAILVLLRADLDGSGVLRFAFTPKLALQWPAAVGGVAGEWRPELGGFAISEPSARFAAVVASPWATSGTKGMQYLLPDGQLEIEIPLEYVRCAREIVPLVITAAAGADAPRQALETYRRVVRSIPALVHEHESAWRERIEALPTVSVSGGAVTQEVFRDAALTLMQSLVKSDALGDGCVAGFGPAGATSQRPGFAWYFSGDVGFNAPAYLGAGLPDVLATALCFAARHQREDGKIPHEVVLSAPWCEWFTRYPFAYIHGDTTALWVHALRLELDATGDLALLAELWPAVKKSYAWMTRQDADGDGLPDNALAGMGASEVGALLADLRTDIHLAATFAAATGDVGRLARAMHDDELAAQASRVAARARQRLLDGLWDESAGSFAHALSADGTLSPERSAWTAMPIWLGLAEGERARRTMERIGQDDMTTDWGVRILASTSAHYDPKGYNSGAVWPFLTGIAALADFRCGRADAGWRKLASVRDLARDAAPGCLPEVLSGARAIALDNSVPHQVFSSGAIVTGVVSGLFGFEPRLLDGEIAIRPCLPADWKGAALAGVRAGKQLYTILLTRDAQDPRRLDAVVEIELNGSREPLPIRFEPRNALPGRLEVRARP
jgi:glycogen debranching enzyme